MNAKVKCSNCGAEISNLTMSWPKWQMLLPIPFLVIVMVPIFRSTFFGSSPSEALTIGEVQQRTTDGDLEILGVITNTTSRGWSSVTVEAEFFDASGAFIDEANEYLRSDIAGNAREHFKIRIHNPSSALTAPDTKMVVKVSGGHTSLF